MRENFAHFRIFWSGPPTALSDTPPKQQKKPGFTMGFWTVANLLRKKTRGKFQNKKKKIAVILKK